MNFCTKMRNDWMYNSKRIYIIETCQMLLSGNVETKLRSSAFFFQGKKVERVAYYCSGKGIDKGEES